jgi:hypothetical protein
MLKFLFRHAMPLACAWLVWAPAAQAAETEPAPEPASPAQPPFDQYRAWRDEPLRGWREANKRVDEVGGWRTYLREAQQGNGSADQGRHQH